MYYLYFSRNWYCSLRAKNYSLFILATWVLEPKALKVRMDYWLRIALR